MREGLEQDEEEARLLLGLLLLLLLGGEGDQVLGEELQGGGDELDELGLAVL